MPENILLLAALVPLLFSIALLVLGYKRKKKLFSARLQFVFAGVFLLACVGLVVYAFVAEPAIVGQEVPPEVLEGPPELPLSPAGSPQTIADVSPENPGAVEFIAYTVSLEECDRFCFSVGVIDVVRGDLREDDKVIVEAEMIIPLEGGMIVRIQGETRNKRVFSDITHIEVLGRE